MNSHAPDCIRTPRLVLRAWSPEDGPDLRRVLDESDAHLRRFIPFMADEPRTLEATTAWLGVLRTSFDAGEHHRYAVRDADGALVGECMLIRRGADPRIQELGYWLGLGWEGRGYATEASAALTRIALDRMGVERLEIVFESANVKSRALAERLGYRRTGRRPGVAVRDGEPVELEVWEVRSGSLSPALARVEAWDGAGAPLLDHS